MVRVLIHAYNTFYQNKSGGVQTRVFQFIENLRKKVSVDTFNPFSTKVGEYDILHCFMLTFETLGLVECAKKNNVKVIISTICTGNNTLKIKLKKMISFLPIYTDYKIERKIISLADHLIVESNQEKEFLIKYYNADSEKISTIPNGVGETAYYGDEIFQITNNKYILQVGRFDRNKNQLNVIRAIKGTGLDLVFIGGANHTEKDDYYQKCLDEAKDFDNIHFLGWQDKESPLLKSAYAHAEVLCLSSYKETFGLVLLEGAMAGAKLCFSKTLPIVDYGCFEQSHLFDPSDVNDIREKLIKTFYEAKDIKLKERVKSMFSWDEVIDQHLKIYNGRLK